MTYGNEQKKPQHLIRIHKNNPVIFSFLSISQIMSFEWNLRNLRVHKIRSCSSFSKSAQLFYKIQPFKVKYLYPQRRCLTFEIYIINLTIKMKLPHNNYIITPTITITTPFRQIYFSIPFTFTLIRWKLFVPHLKMKH